MMYVGNDLQWHFNPNIQLLNKLAVFTHDCDMEKKSFFSYSKEVHVTFYPP